MYDTIRYIISPFEDGRDGTSPETWRFARRRRSASGTRYRIPLDWLISYLVTQRLVCLRVWQKYRESKLSNPCNRPDPQTSTFIGMIPILEIILHNVSSWWTKGVLSGFVRFISHHSRRAPVDWLTNLESVSYWLHDYMNSVNRSFLRIQW